MLPDPNISDHPRRLSSDIDYLLGQFAVRQLTLHEILSVMHGRGYTLLLILMALPFCTPIPLPGLSPVFGSLIALLGFRLSLRQEPWLPQRVLRKELSPKLLVPVLTASRRVAISIEHFLRPRWSFLVSTNVLHHLYGIVICLSGVMLLLPLPIPFSNMFPALTIVLIGAALLENDGYFIIAGLLMFVASLVFFGTVFAGGAVAVDWLGDWWRDVSSQPDSPSPPAQPEH